MSTPMHVAYKVTSRATTIDIEQDDLDVTGLTSGLREQTVRVTGVRVIDYMNGRGRVLVTGHPMRMDGKPAATTIDVRVSIDSVTDNPIGYPAAPDWVVALAQGAMAGGAL